MRPATLPTAALAASILFLTAAAASAQACLGLPSRDGQIAVAAAAGSLDGDTQYGGEFSADVTGPAAFGFGYGGVGADGDRQIFTARASYDFFLLEPAICGVAGVLYDTAPGGDVDHRLGIPVGIGIGKTLRSERFTATVFAVPQYVWTREKVLLLQDVSGDDVRTSNEFMAEAGVTVGVLPFYVGGSVVVTTFDDNDPGFRIRAGLMF